jgi:FAD-linked sulfhydryl oxidase
MSSSSSCRVCDDDKSLFTRMFDTFSSVSDKGVESAQTSQPGAGIIGLSPSSAPSSLLPCPPDRTRLGHSGWTLLHTMAAYYPVNPTKSQQTSMSSFLTNFSSFYPCSHCSSHMSSYLDSNPPDTDSRSSLSLYLCEFHNEVNEITGKPKFDCSRVLERWAALSDKTGKSLLDDQSWKCNPKQFSDIKQHDQD